MDATTAMKIFGSLLSVPAGSGNRFMPARAQPAQQVVCSAVFTSMILPGSGTGSGTVGLPRLSAAETRVVPAALCRRAGEVLMLAARCLPSCVERC